MASFSTNLKKKVCVYNNADYGISLQNMLCERNGLDVNRIAAGHFLANVNNEYDNELKLICDAIESKLPSKIKFLTTYTSFTEGYTGAREKTSPHNFILENGNTLSIRTMKTGDKVAPRTLGQAGIAVLNDFFSEIYGGIIKSQEDVKKLMWEHIHEVFPYFVQYLFKSDYTIFVNRKSPQDLLIIKADEVAELTYERKDFTFTKDITNWKESTTLKYKGVSIAEIQTHTNRFFKFRFHISKLQEWLKLVKETNETLGITLESAICKVFNLKSPDSFSTRVNPVLERNLMPIIEDAFKNMPAAVRHTGSESGSRGENSKCSYDFILAGDQTLSVKSNKGRMVCPPEVGQPGSDTCLFYFKEFFESNVDKVTNVLFKNMVYNNIENIIPIYLDHLFDSDWLLWIFKDKSGYSYKVIEKTKVSSIKWDRALFSFTKEKIEDWNESNTVKYKGITLGEFQVHTSRTCFKFRFQMANLLNLLGIE